MAKKTKTSNSKLSSAFAAAHRGTAMTKLLAKPAAVKKSAKPAPAKAAAKPAAKPTASAGGVLPPKYDKPLGSYSPYAQHRILLEKWGTDAAGQAKVLEYGTKTLKLPEGQVKTYIKEKLQAILRDAQKKAGLHPTKTQVESVAFKFEPHFKHATRDDAKRALLGIARRSHTTERAYHIVSEKGKFAVVPAHILPAGKPPSFKVGDIVMDTIIGDSRAKIKEAGPEQSIIEYVSERKYAPKVQCVSNYYLVKLDAAELKAFNEEQREAEKPAKKAAPKKAAPKKAAPKKAAAPMQKAAASKKSASKKSATKKGARR